MLATNSPEADRIFPKLTSQQELAIWQPAWPTIFVQISIRIDIKFGRLGGGVPTGPEQATLTVDADNLTHGGCVCKLLGSNGVRRRERTSGCGNRSETLGGSKSGRGEVDDGDGDFLRG